jgi:hypothetical protein
MLQQLLAYANNILKLNPCQAIKIKIPERVRKPSLYLFSQKSNCTLPYEQVNWFL